MRERIVAADVVEAVIGLGPNLFYNSPMEACVVVCRSKKAPARAGRVLFIDAVNEVSRERAQSLLTPANINRIASAFDSFEAEPGFAALATLDEISTNSNNLSIPLYVKREREAAGGTDLPDCLRAWRESASDLRVLGSEFFDLLVGERVAP
jgi:type I restriction enzyme M protein